MVESTYNWYWLVDGLMEAEYRVHLANPAAMQQYSGLKYTDDDSDARWLAHLFRLGVLPEGYIYPKAARAVRDLLRKRAHLVRQHTANVLSVQNILARNTGARFSGKRIQERTKQELTTLLAEDPQVLAVTSSLMVLDCLQHQIKMLEQSVHKHLHHTPSYEQLLTVQGIGTVLAHTITLEPGEIRRFPTVGHSASYCRGVDSTRSAMASAKGRAMGKMATRIWPGRIGKRRSLPCVFSRQPGAFTNASWPRAATIRSWHGKPWLISCPGRAITSCETACPMRRRNHHWSPGTITSEKTKRYAAYNLTR